MRKLQELFYKAILASSLSALLPAAAEETLFNPSQPAELNRAKTVLGAMPDSESYRLQKGILETFVASQEDVHSKALELYWQGLTDLYSARPRNSDRTEAINRWNQSFSQFSEKNRHAGLWFMQRAPYSLGQYSLHLRSEPTVGLTKHNAKGVNGSFLLELKTAIGLKKFVCKVPAGAKLRGTRALLNYSIESKYPIRRVQNYDASIVVPCEFATIEETGIAPFYSTEKFIKGTNVVVSDLDGQIEPNPDYGQIVYQY